MKKTTVLLASLLALSACGKNGFHEAPACNRNFTVTASGESSSQTLTQYWFTVEGSGMIGSAELLPVGSTVCLYVAE